MDKQVKTIKTGVFYRMIPGGARVADDGEESRKVDLSFSSEMPVLRWFGTEILDHDPKSVRMDFMKSGRTPLLKDHNREIQTGVVETASISDRVGRASVRFGKSDQADQEFNDIKDGIRSNVSVGYQVHEMVLEKQSDDGDVFRVTDWEPLELSIVSIPADTSVGVGRAQDEKREFETRIITKLEEKKTMDPQNKTKEKEKETVVVEPIDRKKIEAETREAERGRVAEIMALGDAHNCRDDALKAIEDGKSVDQFRQKILDVLKSRGLKPIDDPDPNLGLTEKEAKAFSFIRAIAALADPKNSRAQEAAAFEFEVSRAFAEKTNRSPRGLFVPPDVLKRDLTVGTDDAGGYLVATDLRPQDFISVLRNKLVCEAAGARVIDDLVGDVAIPKMSAGATAYWVAESGAPTESQQTLAQVALAPKTIAAFTDISRKLLIQASLSVEQMVREDLAAILARAVDLAGLHGTGSNNQPTGVAATSGIGSVAGGTNGAAPDWADIIDLETEIAVDNADLGALAYITNAKVRGKLKQTLITATYGEGHVWDRNNPDTPLNGYPAFVTNQVSSALTKGTSSGVCSAIFFGNWADLILAFWSGLDILVDPYTGSSTATVRVTCFQDVDVAVRHAESFAAMLDALTT